MALEMHFGRVRRHVSRQRKALEVQAEAQRGPASRVECE